MFGPIFYRLFRRRSFLLSSIFIIALFIIITYSIFPSSNDVKEAILKLNRMEKFNKNKPIVLESQIGDSQIDIETELFPVFREDNDYGKYYFDFIIIETF